MATTNLFPATLTSIPGVANVTADHAEERLVVEFKDGTTVTVLRSPLAKFSRRRQLFDVWLPATRGPGSNDVAPSKTGAEVVALLSALAAKAA